MNKLGINQIENGDFKIYLTEELQEELGDIEYVDIHSMGKISKDDVLVNIEASKAAIEIPIDFDANIKTVNNKAMDFPKTLNSNNLEENWLVIVEKD